MPPFPLQPSLWAATAVPPPPVPALDQSVATDACIIGGGYAGLATALHLAEAGTRVVLIEAEEIGWGGSGRNGGQVIPGLKFDPDELVQKLGPEAGGRLVDFAGRTADAVFELIARHQMDVPHVRRGWIQGAHTADALRTVARRAEEWRRRGADVDVLDKPAIDRLLGTSAYLGGWIDRRGGGVQPLSFARELARAALKAGAHIHGATRATGLVRRDGRWQVTTAQGPAITADRVIVTTNGYTGDLVQKLRRSVIAVNSYQVATAPLPPDLRAAILPEGQVTSDARKLLLYFRLDHTGRLLMGGRGPFREPRGAQDWAHLERVITRFFPALAGIAIDYRWCGRLAVTRDYLPHLHEPEPGLTIALGCQGRGVGLQTAMGQAIAAYVTSGDASHLPLAPTRIAPIPFHGLQQLYVAAVTAWYRATDRGGVS
jgi:glycine/D-amino acid oxidase-like deaminating enzyme